MAIVSHPDPLFDGLLVRPAQPGEGDTVLDLLAEAAAWLQSRGIAQWPARFPAQSVLAQIGEGQALLVEQDRRPVATLAVLDDDAELSGSNSGSAYYISRLAVARWASGAGLGYRIIDWVADKSIECGRCYVRLATASNNPELRRYYEQAGFEHVSDPLHARWPTSLYQRRAGSTLLVI